MPVDSGTWFGWALEVTCDPHGKGYQLDPVDNPGRAKRDDYDELPRLLPDLRAADRGGVFSGRVPKA